MPSDSPVKSHALSLRERHYGMKKHWATRLHYDLRLECNGSLLSWVIPTGPDRNPANSQDVIQMEDHRSKYLDFEGVHRTGTVMLWDVGTWELHPESGDIEGFLKLGVLRFTLRAEKLEGSWTLTRTVRYENGNPVWLLCKDEDEFAVQDVDDILERLPNSVKRGRTKEDIELQWSEGKKPSQQQLLMFQSG
jgi:bifunctional non-homologous end joining protein LigD